MPFLPFNILGVWFRGLLSIAILAGAAYLLYSWYDDSHIIERVTTVRTEDAPGEERVTVRRVFRFEPGWNRPTFKLVSGVALLAWATVGRWVGHGLWMLMLMPGTGPSPGGAAQTTGADPAGKKRRKKGRRHNPFGPAAAVPEADEDPTSEREGEVHTIRRPDGSVLRVECYGPAAAPPLILTHGWGVNSTEWFYLKRHLTQRFRLILWDEPGLGLSKKPGNNDYRLENLAADLDAVLTFAGKPAVLVGHSIGGMISLTFCKASPEALGARVTGLVLVHTTYTNPVRTTRMAALYTALEKPVLVPLLYLTIALWPVVWLMNWMSYLNGSAHRSTHKSSFCNETRGQLDFAASFTPHGRPDVLARGMLGMMGYDATGVLARINVPTLVVVGDQDALTTPESGAFMAERIPGAKLVTLTPAKHMGFLEHHERFDRVVSEFAGECQAASVKG